MRSVLVGCPELSWQSQSRELCWGCGWHAESTSANECHNVTEDALFAFLSQLFLFFPHQISISVMSTEKDFIKIFKWWKTDIRENVIRAWWVSAAGSHKDRRTCSTSTEASASNVSEPTGLNLFWVKMSEVWFNALLVLLSTCFQNSQSYKTILVGNSWIPDITLYWYSRVSKGQWCVSHKKSDLQT